MCSNYKEKRDEKGGEIMSDSFNEKWIGFTNNSNLSLQIHWLLPTLL
jgi:hypothetical protein